MKGIIIYYSRAGENYCSGSYVNLKKGNTEAAAEYLGQITGYPLFKIEQKEPYSDVYLECVEQAQKDQKERKRPTLVRDLPDLSSYDLVYLGYPNFWGTFPMAVFAFLEAHGWKGKAIKPFCTNEGSGFGDSLRDLAKECPGARILEGLPIHGSEVSQSLDVIKDWAGRKD